MNNTIKHALAIGIILQALLINIELWSTTIHTNHGIPRGYNVQESIECTGWGILGYESNDCQPVQKYSIKYSDGCNIEVNRDAFIQEVMQAENYEILVTGKGVSSREVSVWPSAMTFRWGEQE